MWQGTVFQSVTRTTLQTSKKLLPRITTSYLVWLSLASCIVTWTYPMQCTKSEEISSPSKLFHGVQISYFPGTCVSKGFYSNLISKSRSHLIFTVKLSFYVLFLGLIFRNYLLSPKLNHGFSGKNTTFSKINYKIRIIQNIYL